MNTIIHASTVEGIKVLYGLGAASPRYSEWMLFSKGDFNESVQAAIDGVAHSLDCLSETQSLQSLRAIANSGYC